MACSAVRAGEVHISGFWLLIPKTFSLNWEWTVASEEGLSSRALWSVTAPFRSEDMQGVFVQFHIPREFLFADLKETE